MAGEQPKKGEGGPHVVESVDEALARGDELGAVVALPKTAVGGVGWLAYSKDPDGNILGLLQPDPAAA